MLWNDKPYHSLDYELKKRFGEKVYRLTLNGGMSCPNRDGHIGYGGCIFCSGGGSGEFAANPSLSVRSQIEAGKALLQSKRPVNKYIAYFQAFTNTYAPVERLEKLYTEAISPEYIVGLSLATRPDCLPDETVDLLWRINKIKPVSVELGFQTSNEKTAEYIRRGYQNSVYFDAVKRLKRGGLEVVTHIIIGLPFETKEDVLNTVKWAVSVGTDGVKFHLLHILKDTDLEQSYLKGEFSCLTLEEYAEILKECISILPPQTVVHRITGDGAKKDLVAPLWSADKKKVLNFLNKYLKGE